MQPEPLKDTVIIYHKNCPDGFGAAYAAWKKFGDNASYVPWNDHETIPDNLLGKTIYVVDFSFFVPLLNELIENNISVVVIDHHKSVEADIRSFPQNIFDINHSGCALTWQYFHPDTEMPILLRYVEDNDLWKHELPQYQEFLVALHQHPRTFEDWNNLIEHLKVEKNLTDFIAEGSLLAKFENKLVDELVAGRELVLFEGHEVYAVNASRIYRDMIGNTLAGINAAEGRLAFGIVYYHKGGVVTLSLRSSGDVDVAEMAMKYGGGGHKNASALRVNNFTELPFTFVDGR